MADEPNKRMDEMLRACAEQRRQEPPLELHPATRQLLQGEVARTYQKPRQTPWLQRLITFWPRIAFAAACLAITLTLVLIILPPRTVTQMAQAPAKAESKESDAFYDAPAAPAPSMTPQPPSRDIAGVAKDREAASELKAKSEGRADADAVKLMREEVAAKPAVGRFANSASTRYKQAAEESNVQLGAKLQNTQPVLNNFVLEQSGDRVRIVDQDGSIYAGSLVALQNETQQRLFRTRANRPADQQLFFRAVGTNLSLNKQVSIEANIVPMVTNAIPELAPANAKKTDAVQQTIRGRARVGTNQEIFLNAVPEP